MIVCVGRRAGKDLPACVGLYVRMCVSAYVRRCVHLVLSSCVHVSMRMLACVSECIRGNVPMGQCGYA